MAKMVLLMAIFQSTILSLRKTSCYVQNLTVICHYLMRANRKRRYILAVDYESIGRRIKHYRTEKKMSQEELGDLVAVNAQHISNIEGSRRYPSLEIIIAIANALDVSADDLLTDNLKHSSSPVGTEIHDLLLDCNHDEKAILTRTLTFLKGLLSEFGV